MFIFGSGCFRSVFFFSALRFSFFSFSFFSFSLLMTVRNITKSSFVALRNGSFPTLSILFFFYIQTSYIPIVVGRIPGIQLMKLVIFFLLVSFW